MRAAIGIGSSMGGSMRIEASSVSCAAQHELTVRQTRRESVRTWVDAGPAAPDAEAAADRFERVLGGGTLGRVRGRVPGISGGRTRSARAAGAREPLDDEVPLDAHLRMLKLILEEMLGVQVEIRLVDPEAVTRCQKDRAAAADPPADSGRQGWGIEVTVEKEYVEAETTTFLARGTVRTAAGTSAFELETTMARTFSQEGRLTLRAGDAAVDPLVVNITGGATELSGTRFQFDLTRDGGAESVPMLAPGSGFLALDRNGDGRVTDGSELFGPSSGDGFAELARLDADGNRWIDESDSAYEQLRLWEPAVEGDGTLTPLATCGVGAIYLGAIQTPFSLKTDENALQGQVVASSVYLRESGEAGSIQQVDLAV